MAVTVAKRFDFHASHRLPHHEGQCRRLHGHTYGLEVAVTGPVETEVGTSSEGMVLDFSGLKDLYKMLIEPFVEHQHLNETLASEALEVRFPLWTEEIKDNPNGSKEKVQVPLTTAEGLATWCHATFEHGLFKLLGLNVLHYKVQVTIWETPTSYAQVGSKWRKG